MRTKPDLVEILRLASEGDWVAVVKEIRERLEEGGDWGKEEDFVLYDRAMVEAMVTLE